MQLLTPEDMAQLHPAWKELWDLSTCPDIAEDSKVRAVVLKGVRSVAELQALADAAADDLGAGRIGANVAQCAMLFVERVLAVCRLVGQAMPDEGGEDLAGQE